jgi:hypothetical protein
MIISKDCLGILEAEVLVPFDDKTITDKLGLP